MKFSDLIAVTLKELGFTHFFFVGGGNIMHLTGSLVEHLTPVPVIHEVAAVIASEYFNKISAKNRSIALVTAGPGATNTITGIAGAHLEARAVLVLGGQVKTSDLKEGCLRQRGIQEVDGVSICKPITKKSLCLKSTLLRSELAELFELPFKGKQGPVFIEIPLDVQGSKTLPYKADINEASQVNSSINKPNINSVILKINASRRPVFLIGGGTPRNLISDLLAVCEKQNIPIATTWNGADLIGAEHSSYIGRPNTWGQRSSNVIIQQSDLVIALGTRIGLQQSGFNWRQFLPDGELIMVDIDKAELEKGHPRIDHAYNLDAALFLKHLLPEIVGNWREWLNFARSIRSLLPLNEAENNFKPPHGFVQPYGFVEWLSNNCERDAIVVPCSSGSAFTCMMQVFSQKSGQRMITNKGLASMGYGLSGAIGAALASGGKRTYLVEGDGGFAQNIQELGTVAILDLNLKIFIFEDQGHASIRMTQKNYFDGEYVGCDRTTGLGLPNWEHIGAVWGINTVIIDDLEMFQTESCVAMLESNSPAVFIIKIHPEQTYFPKISSQIAENGNMESSPLHLMTPSLSEEKHNQVFKFLETTKANR